ncbi:SH3 domain-containing protein [Longimicrobium sp.]|uniref:SH3 domain-containing protein n=1 Tax=Longimicrobium sp. TaxID=2029185 RepID=UPI002E3725FB|nr:SH3 domain-containing protein [Longimicrobium sp.]HEX6039710.1 SH3 domain-containing protein [Longimicrobium sp.]
MSFIPRPCSTARKASRSPRHFALVILLALTACADADDSPSAEIASRFTFSTDTTSSSDTTPAPATEPRDWLYIHETLNVRAQPDKDASVVRKLNRGDMVQLGPRDANGWARIYTGSVGDEYVYRASNAVRTDSPPPLQPLATVAPERGRRPSSAASRGYHLGPRGGCYTYTRSGNKRYVDRSNCY